MKPILANIILLFGFLFINLPEAARGGGFDVEKFREKNSIGDKNVITKCPSGVKCVRPIQCPAYIRMQKKLPQFCEIEDGVEGVCCTTGYNHQTLEKDIVHMIKRRSIDDRVEKAVQVGKNLLEQVMEKVEKHSANMSRTHSDSFHDQFLNGGDPNDMKMSESINYLALEEIFASTAFKDLSKTTLEDAQLNNYHVSYERTSLGKRCVPGPPCRVINSKYRSIDGRCNNPIAGRSMWGAAGTAMERLLPPAYTDGVWSPRDMSASGSKLRSPRTISRTVFIDSDMPHHKYNLMLMQFGQFLAHDFTRSSSIRLPDGKPIDCCKKDNSGPLSGDLLHFACMPIEIDGNDEFYSKFNVRCMNFVRASLAPNTKCKFSYARQRSNVTHYIDGSAIYGSSMETMRSVREFNGGRLKALVEGGKGILPLADDNDTCDIMAQSCFLAGDSRVNQILSLTALHIMFLREHNRVAGILAILNPHWSDSKLFKEARRIVVAELQHITYNEYLPLVIGHHNMRIFDLKDHHGQYNRAYDPNIKVSITSEFQAAAFRFGHSSVAAAFNVGGENIPIETIFSNPSRLREPTFYDKIVRAIVDEPMQKVDDFMVHGLTRHLFQGQNPFGLDLASLNIQRGRDEGIRPYNDYLRLSGFGRAKNFEDFGVPLGGILAHVYDSPDDIDLWVGGLMENPANGAIFGPTFSEIISDQFVRFKVGDRYYYANGPEINPGSFTPEQLFEIQKVTLARLICDNADSVDLMQAPNAFKQTGTSGNAPVPCNSGRIPSIDLNLWAEKH